MYITPEKFNLPRV